MKGKKWRRLAAGLLAGMLLFGAAGCGGKENGDLETAGGFGGSETASSGEVAKGRYMEVQKDTPESLTAIDEMVRLSDGGVAVFAPDTGELYISADNGDTWETKELAALQEQMNMGSDITTNAIAPDGGFFFSYVQWGSDSEDEEDESDAKVEEHYVYINSAGDAKELPLQDNADILYLQDAVFINDTQLFGLEIGLSVCRIDLEAETMEAVAISEELSDDLRYAGDFFLSDKGVYQISTDDTIEDTLLCDFVKQETADYKRMAFYFDSQENRLYTASASGLYSHVVGGSSMEQLLDGGLSNLGDPTKTAVSLLKNEDGSFLIAYEDGEIDSYTYDKEALAVPSEQITVYTLNQNTTVSKAISLFRKKHPDVFVKQEVGILGTYGITEEDAIRNLNTKLLAGEGPDILLMDGMPLDSYIEKNVLLDLSGTIDGLEGENTYFSNILHAYQSEDGLYAVPIRYRIPVVVGEKDVIGGILDFASFAEAVGAAREKHPAAETVMGLYTPEELLKRLYVMMASSAFFEDAKPNAAAIRSFLEQAREIYEREQENLTPALLEQHNRNLVWREEYGLVEEDGNFSVDGSMVFDLLSNRQSMAIGTLSGMQDFQYAEGIPENADTLAYELLRGQEESVFCPKGIAGINAKSKELELATEFLQELLGMDVQKSDLGDGFPVNADAYDAFAANPNPNSEPIGFAASTVMDNGETDEMVEFTVGWPKDGAIASLKEKIGTLKAPGLSDEVIRAAILESGKKVLEGDLTVEEGCDEIVQKVGLYLAE